MAAQWKRGDAAAVGNVLDTDEAGDGRQVEHHPPIPRQKVALPREPYHYVAAAHQEAVSGMGQALRVVRGWRVVEELQYPFVAAIAVIEKDPPIAAFRVERLQNREIAGKPNEPLGIGRHLVDVGDPLLRRRIGVDRETR